MAVWFLTGFWHGASWNFILWGLLLFLIMSAERLGLLAVLERWSFLGHLYMLFVIPLTWLVFAVTDIGQIALYLQRLFPVFARQKQFVYFSGDYLKYGKLYAISLAAGLIFMTDIPGRIYRTPVFPDHGYWTSGRILVVCVLYAFRAGRSIFIFQILGGGVR